jgi:hypothetical protein
MHNPASRALIRCVFVVCKNNLSIYQQTWGLSYRETTRRREIRVNLLGKRLPRKTRESDIKL